MCNVTAEVQAPVKHNSSSSGVDVNSENGCFSILEKTNLQIYLCIFQSLEVGCGGLREWHLNLDIGILSPKCVSEVIGSNPRSKTSGQIYCVQPQYCSIARSKAALCSWGLVPAWLCLLCSSCQHLGVEHRPVPAKTIGRRAVMLTGLLLHWAIYLVCSET